mgnify:CR=1 FL=1
MAWPSWISALPGFVEFGAGGSRPLTRWAHEDSGTSRLAAGSAVARGTRRDRNMLCEPTSLPGVLVVTPRVYRDPRGYFMETYHATKYREAGISAVFVQDNLSRSVRGTLRGLHTQRRRAQGKLIRVVEGEIYDVAVDIRRGSPMFLRWVGVYLSGEHVRQCYVPPGFAHGFCVLSDHAVVEYKCTDLYDPTDELGIAWNDPSVGVGWPIADPILSPKDGAAQRLREVLDLLPAYPGCEDEGRIAPSAGGHSA